MPTNRTPIQRRRQMSFSEEMALEFGDSPPTTFATDQERRAAWEQHRDYLMAKCDRGWRPAAWWDYDAPRLGVRRPRDPEYEKAALWEAGLLTPEEKATLERDWRQHFDEANSPDYFGHCIGYDKARHCAVWAKGEE